ncbi:hypothetical protein CYJ36_23050 [Bacillus sp. UMB0893]|nr:hypothetical protein CYJ36_23050 [Bacillus sp. UMB0893]
MRIIDSFLICAYNSNNLKELQCFLAIFPWFFMVQIATKLKLILCVKQILMDKTGTSCLAACNGLFYVFYAESKGLTLFDRKKDDRSAGANFGKSSVSG